MHMACSRHADAQEPLSIQDEGAVGRGERRHCRTHCIRDDSRRQAILD